MLLYRQVFDTPVGPMIAIASEDALCALEFSSPGRTSRLETRLARWFTPYDIADRTNSRVEESRDWLAAYFSGELMADPPLDMRGGPFELRVWAALRTIPRGDTTSYGEIARRVGSPGGSRAVGMANGANPVAMIVPCHRVIGANGTLTGYGGGLDRKAWLLEHERRFWSGAAGSPGPRWGSRQPGPPGKHAAAGRLPLDG